MTVVMHLIISHRLSCSMQMIVSQPAPRAATTSYAIDCYMPLPHHSDFMSTESDFFRSDASSHCRLCNSTALAACCRTLLPTIGCMSRSIHVDSSKRCVISILVNTNSRLHIHITRHSHYDATHLLHILWTSTNIDMIHISMWYLHPLSAR